MSDKNNDDTTRIVDRSSRLGTGKNHLSGTKRPMVEVGTAVEDDGESESNKVVVKTPFLEVFNNGLIVENILIFLDSKEIASKRRVAKLWNPLGLKVLKNPLHGKKAFESNEELRYAVKQYCHGQRYSYDLGYPTTNKKKQFEIKCMYGFIIGKWDVRQVQDFRKIFFGMEEFNEPLEWDTSNATTMEGMFDGAYRFNSSLGPKFCTSNVRSMKDMFASCFEFNQPDISKFDTSSVENMRSMFSFATSFNQPLTMFNTSRVVDMMHMFCEALRFNQSLEGLDTSKVTNMRGMLASTPFGNENINMLVNDWGWNLSKLQHGIEEVINYYLY